MKVKKYLSSLLFCIFIFISNVFCFFIVKVDKNGLWAQKIVQNRHRISIANQKVVNEYLEYETTDETYPIREILRSITTKLTQLDEIYEKSNTHIEKMAAQLVYSSSSSSSSSSSNSSGS